MTDYCLFTVELKGARRIYIRGVANITEPVDEYEKIIEFYHGDELKKELPSNPYEPGSDDYKLFERLLEIIRTDFERFGDELVFAKEKEETLNYMGEDFILNIQKVTID